MSFCFLMALFQNILNVVMNDQELFQKLSIFDCQSNDFLKWDCFVDVISLIKIDGLNIDKLYNEYCGIKLMHDAI